ncbi:hypothetical protein Catovirus_1_940 [Catovirus CTV1]|uniref:Uncharacterized protein n=1 Tax=Catovirus CTV1 TaxID=1977631 RepID=A0A1V0SAY7_9VIRU|nr:hypothetical protein Catovirus_1_940 [Catovirus CTV1]
MTRVTKKTLKSSDNNEEQQDNEQKKPTRTVSVGKKDWVDNKQNNVEDDKQEDEEEDYTEPAELSGDDQDTTKKQDDQETKQNGPDSFLKDINMAVVEELDKTRLSDLSNTQLFEVLYARGLKQKNPTVFHTARKALTELSLGVNFTRPKHNPHRFQNNNGSRRGNFRGNFRGKNYRNRTSNEKS